MLGFKNLIIIITVLWLFSTVVLDFSQDLVFLITSGFSEESRNKIVNDIGALVSLGQSRVKEGVLGMVELKEMRCVPNYTADCSLTELQVKGLASSYKDNILKGTFVSLIYVIIFFLILNKGTQLVTGFPIPAVWSLVVSVLITGLIAWAFMGFEGYPYEGFILLIKNSWLWSEQATALAPP